MDMGQIILGRLWLFDKDDTIYGWSNMCQFVHMNKKIKLLPLNSSLDNMSKHLPHSRKLKELT